MNFFLIYQKLNFKRNLKLETLDHGTFLYKVHELLLITLQKEDANITGHLICTNYKVSPIPAGGLEVPLLLTSSVKSERVFELMKSFVNDLYEYNYTGEQAKNNEEESSDDEEIDIQIPDCTE